MTNTKKLLAATVGLLALTSCSLFCGSSRPEAEPEPEKPPCPAAPETLPKLTLAQVMALPPEVYIILADRQAAYKAYIRKLQELCIPVAEDAVTSYRELVIR